MKSEAVESVDDLADRIERAGDRYRNAGDYGRESESRSAAKSIRESVDISRAYEIARRFESGSRLRPKSEISAVTLESRPQRRPWWKWWRSTRTDDS